MPHIARWQQYPELVAIDNYHQLPGIALMAACYAFDGYSGLLWGFVMPTVGIWHATYSVNSLCHVFGERRFATSDNSRNNAWLALATLGGSWHNNHHAFHWSAREGLKWWEVDLAYWTLLGLEKVGVVWGLKLPSDAQVERLEAKHAKDPAKRIKNTLIPAHQPPSMNE
jgi:stearoyl-CoA desaturase (delta-9 desaturase)